MYSDGSFLVVATKGHRFRIEFANGKRGGGKSCCTRIQWKKGEKVVAKHEFNYDGKTISVAGVVKVVQISEKECVFKLDGTTLTIRGDGLNVTRLDKERGEVVMESDKLHSAVYRGGASLKGLFA